MEVSDVNAAASRGKTVELMQTLLASVRQTPIDFVLGYSCNALTTFPHVADGPQNRSFCDVLGVPVVNYWPDPLLETHHYTPYLLLRHDRSRLCGPKIVHLLKDQPAADEMREVYGITNAYGLPLGVNTEAFRPRDGARDIDVLFVGGSDAPPWRDTPPDAAPSFEALIANRLASARPLVRRLLDLTPFPPPLREEMIRLALTTFDRKTQTPELNYWATMKEIGAAPDLASALATLRQTPEVYYQLRQLWIEAAMLPRGYLVRNVADRFATVVLGGERWADWGVNYQGWADYEQQAAWYSRAKIGLNYTMIWDEVGVNYKVFEITACRALCITNYRRQLEDLFDLDREIVVYRTQDELIDKIDFYLKHDAERERIAEAGHRRTLTHHTFRHRARDILTILKRDFGLAPSPVASAPNAAPAAAEPDVAPTGSA